MGNGCTLPCQKKIAPMPIVSQVHTNFEIKSKEVPHGCCLLYAGVPTDKNEYTCPILAVHTWHKTEQNMKTEEGIMHTVGIQGGYSSNMGGNTTMITNKKNKVEFKVGVDEQIRMVPVEDIISIEISTEVKKAIEQKKTMRQKHRPTEDLSCGEKVKKCCVKNVFCCCRSCCDKEKPVVPEYEFTTNQKQGATRVITVTIRHLRHGLVDTPSILPFLSKEKQTEYYHNQMHVDTVAFYYLHNETFDEDEYRMQLQDSEALARLVLQLKAMIHHYPDESQLQKMIQQNFSHHFGQKLTEDIPILEGTAQVTTITTRQNNQPRLT